ncbi:MAG: hypothetical protein FWD31_11180 [Planctomycetaceae bacterium]|nr:hypothetical protein [Planctomycetaceae bacterium]
MPPCPPFAAVLRFFPPSNGYPTVRQSPQWADVVAQNLSVGTAPRRHCQTISLNART